MSALGRFWLANAGLACLCVTTGFAQGAVTNTPDYLEPAGTGFQTLTYGPDGRLGQLVIGRTENTLACDPHRLAYRERMAGGAWGELETVEEESWDGGGADAWNRGVALFLDAGGDADVYFPTVFAGVRHYRRHAGAWSCVEEVKPSNDYWDLGYDLKRVAATRDENGVVHFAFYQENYNQYPTRLSILYGSRQPGGTWNWSTILSGLTRVTVSQCEQAEYDHYWYPRNLSIAVDRSNHVHIVFSVDPYLEAVSGGTAIRSELSYLTNESGAWKRNVILSPGLSFGDAGIGASIAMAPNGTLAVASAYLPRVQTGSPGDASLVYLVRTSAGGWRSSTVATQSDNYRGGDGEQGTGLNPYLCFDEASRPHIVFTDHASEHFEGYGAASFPGQMRYATCSSSTGGTWQLRTIISRGAIPAIDHAIHEPVLAASTNEVAFSAITYGWNYITTEYDLDVFHFSSRTAPPGATTLLCPTGSLTGTVRPEFSWQAVTNVTWYYLWMNRDGAKYLSLWIPATNAWAPATDLPSGDYAWWVQTWNPSGYGPWSDGASFSIPSYKPGSVSPVAPTGTLTATRSPQFEWTTTDRATWYQLWLNRNQQTYLTKWVPSNTTWTAANLPIGNYRWWVRGWNAEGYGPWSTNADFTLPLALPGPCSTVAPTGTVAGVRRPQFNWTASTGATWYYLWMSKGGVKYYEKWVQGTNTWMPTWDLPYGTYAWWVRPWNSDGNGIWSARADFQLSP